ncbi:MAG: JAB domain-containing protein [Bacteroidetes bacterium]|nr:JAB domain-containing protein [Bacteroidota bacterium]
MKQPRQPNGKKMHEVQVVYKRPVLEEMPKIKTSKDVDVLMRQIINLDTLDYAERFYTLFCLSNNNNVLAYAEIGVGDCTSVTVHTKMVFQIALLSHATGIIIIHNHPSGILKASEQDKVLTQKIKEMGILFGIKLLDSVIISSEGYYSFADEGLL